MPAPDSNRPDSNRPRVIAREHLPPSEAKWTKLVKITYEDEAGVRRLWESAERTTRPPGSAIDGVDIVALVNGSLDGTSSEPHILLEKQFRPPVGRTVIELPGGLVDAGETAVEAAVRELREETGFVASPGRQETDPQALTLFADPGFGNTNLQIVYLAVDRSLPQNQNPTPALEDGELVQSVFCVPLAGLLATCRALAAQGYAIDSRLGTLAEGMDMARRFLPPHPAA